MALSIRSHQRVESVRASYWGRIVTVIVAALLLATGCSRDQGASVRTEGGGTGTGTGTGRGTAGGSGTASGVSKYTCEPVGDRATAAETVEVELKEWAVLPVPATAKTGTIHFHLRNTGGDPHEFVIIKAADPATLPTDKDGAVDEEQLPPDALIGEVEGFPSGQECDGTFELAVGAYSLICNLTEPENGAIEAHYKMGMRIPFSVT